MRNRMSKWALLPGLGGLLFVSLFAAGCPSAGSGILSILPFSSITAVQLFDEPDFTIAFSVTGAVSNPAQVSKINWVFGDGGGFVEGPSGRTTITHTYANTGTYQVTAFVFGSSGFIDQINGSVTVLPGDGDTTTPPEETPDRPAKISNASPSNSATEVSVAAVLSWSAGSRATSHDVYLGTSMTGVENATKSDTGLFQGNRRTTSFDSESDLLANTSYFWRVDEVNTGGTTKGDVLTFKTARAPAQARNPIPVDGSNTARVDQVLGWTAGARSTTHDVYFSKDLIAITEATRETADIFIGTQNATTFNPSDEDADEAGNLLPGTLYYWRIDEVGPGGTTRGAVWAFETQPLPPAISGPSPADLAMDASINELLRWTGGVGIESFDVYFGTGQLDVQSATQSSPEFRGNQTGLTFNPGALLPNNAYFWRIDTRGPGGTAHGFLHRFTTVAAPPAAAAPFAPADNAVGVAVNVNLEWTAGLGGVTQSFDVYLSTSQPDVLSGAASALQGNQPVSQLVFNPPTNLTANTNYFWRVDSNGPGGKSVGAIRTFRTGVIASQAESPVPPNDSIGVAISMTNLSWVAGMGATGHDVYLGSNQNSVTNATKMDAAYRGSTTQGVTRIDPGTLLTNTEYFWRVDETAPGGETRGVIWSFTTGPAKAINPNPQNQASDGSVTLTMSWTIGTGATSHDIYLGTSQSVINNATRSTAGTDGAFRGNQLGAVFNPTLEAGTTYFWRIDEVATVGGNLVITKGDIWRFSTGIGKATAPTPADQATGIALEIVLSWTAGAGVLTNDVYFGTDQAAVTNATRTTVGVFRSPTQVATNYDPPEVLLQNTDYFWRIDTVGAINDAQVIKKGDVWRFKTIAPPTPASAPTPLNGAANVATGSTLSWDGGTGTSFDVFFGTSNPPAMQVSGQTTRMFSPVLSSGTTYFWRIDTRNAVGTTPGPLWTFTTAP